MEFIPLIFLWKSSIPNRPTGGVSRAFSFFSKRNTHCLESLFRLKKTTRLLQKGDTSSSTSGEQKSTRKQERKEKLVPSSSYFTESIESVSTDISQGRKWVAKLVYLHDKASGLGRSPFYMA